MTSVAEYKKQMLFKRKLKEDPLGAMGNMGSMNEVLINAFKQVAAELLQNDDFILKIAAQAFERIATPKNGNNGKDGLDGRDGVNGVNGKDGKDGRNGKDGVNGRDGKQGLMGMQGISGKDGTEVKGEDIVKKINNLPLDKDKMIDAKHIKGLTEEKTKGTDLFRGGLKLLWNTTLDGTVNGVNKVFTVPAELPDPKDDRFIVSVRGVLKTSAAGDFAASNGNRTITFTNAPPNGSDSPRIVIYHGK
jgi:hypothetical protein